MSQLAPKEKQRSLRQRGIVDDSIVVGTYSAHPFLGFVRDRLNHPPLWKEYGFVAEADPFDAGKDPKNAIVAITGGSYAEFFFNNPGARKKLRGHLQQLPVFRDKNIVLVMLGMGGYRQPQQLISATYYLVLGGRLDMLINIDGINEVIHADRLTRRGIHPAYPAIWPDLYADQYNPDYLTDLGHIAMWKDLRYATASAFHHVRFSVTASTFWSLLDTYMQKRIVLAQQKITRTNKNAKLPYFVSGPNTYEDASQKQLDDFTVELWKEGSVQLQHLADTNHFLYVHYLQPTPYAKNSKYFSPEEASRAIGSPRTLQNRTISRLDGRLRQGIKELQAQGVNAYDMTNVFIDYKEPLYTDIWGHINPRGKHIQADAIGKDILKRFGPKPGKP